MNEEATKKKLAELKIPLSRLAGHLGVSRSTIYRWFESPETTPLGMVRQIIQFLGLSNEETAAIFML